MRTRNIFLNTPISFKNPVSISFEYTNYKANDGIGLYIGAKEEYNNLLSGVFSSYTENIDTMGLYNVNNNLSIHTLYDVICDNDKFNKYDIYHSGSNSNVDVYTSNISSGYVDGWMATGAYEQNNKVFLPLSQYSSYWQVYVVTAIHHKYPSWFTPNKYLQGDWIISFTITNESDNNFGNFLDVRGHYEFCNVFIGGDRHSSSFAFLNVQLKTLKSHESISIKNKLCKWLHIPDGYFDQHILLRFYFEGGSITPPISTGTLSTPIVTPSRVSISDIKLIYQEKFQENGNPFTIRGYKSDVLENQDNYHQYYTSSVVNESLSTEPSYFNKLRFRFSEDGSKINVDLKRNSSNLLNNEISNDEFKNIYSYKSEIDNRKLLVGDLYSGIVLGNSNINIRNISIDY